MKCHLCVAEGKKSRLYSEPVDQALREIQEADSYFDEEGVGHFHTTSSSTEIFSCSNGHRFLVTTYEKCTGCDFNDKPPLLYTLPRDPKPLTARRGSLLRRAAQHAMDPDSSRATI